MMDFTLKSKFYQFWVAPETIFILLLFFSFFGAVLEGKEAKK